MKRTTLILSAVSALALVGLTTMAIADDDDDGRGWCPKGKYGKGGEYGHMHRGEHMGMGFMGGKHMARFMKDGDFDLKLTPERVKEIMEGKLAWRGNDNLKVGEVTLDKDGKIIAQLVTKDNSLVETFVVDPKTGFKGPMR
ncbi:exported hypothetical protein [Candidatus Terasakiella magnetica]|uniref:PepSY domain-containing protein n=1 Tax=Candidatus Terasakiella magnetica TaxID=1867952 RepID=A0A1C3RI53_9PROT|nr:hypothetical protein [Candidatus Terasakiella magnetica]SCA56945.1 exported hypothetical protein [Candidatus Terasakiella magnetica]